MNRFLHAPFPPYTIIHAQVNVLIAARKPTSAPLFMLLFADLQSQCEEYSMQYVQNDLQISIPFICKYTAPWVYCILTASVAEPLKKSIFHL